MPEATKLIMDGKAIDRALYRMAHEIAERHDKLADVALVGIQTRGVPLAYRLAKKIESFSQCTLPVGELDITLYRDDLRHKVVIPKIQPTHIPFDVSGKSVVLVDDVIFTGRSFQAAINALLEFGRCARITVAVLVDRGHRELPIQADFVGKNLPTSLQEKVSVKVAEIDGSDLAEVYTS